MKQEKKIMNRKLLLLLYLLPFAGLGQNYTSYFTGNNTDVVTSPSGGVCLMGGASEDDNAMSWFLQQANGGDILILRTSGSNGYNSYFYSGLGITVNSVETIVCSNASASSDPYILQKIQQAEAIWFAGGDQWTYISYWRNTPVEVAINEAVNQRKIVIGGTSAGMAIQGKYYFSAQNGTVTSSAALGNPFNNQMTVDSTHFIENTTLSNVITDTHFDNPDRKGRILTFLARIKEDYGQFAKAIACDEYTAVCIDTNGIARVFGGYPTYDDNAYFIQSNCELENPFPENCTPGNPLTWNLGGLALKAYQIKGDATGTKTFDLTDWQTGLGGNWYNWSSSNGVFNEEIGSPLNCNNVSIDDFSDDFVVHIYPNPFTNKLTQLNKSGEENYTFINYCGEIIWSGKNIENHDFSYLSTGVYFLKVNNKTIKLIKQ
jgi:cyanophycinase-like exopeptidase